MQSGVSIRLAVSVAWIFNTFKGDFEIMMIADEKSFFEMCHIRSTKIRVSYIFI